MKSSSSSSSLDDDVEENGSSNENKDLNKENLTPPPSPTTFYLIPEFDKNNITLQDKDLIKDKAKSNSEDDHFDKLMKNCYWRKLYDLVYRKHFKDFNYLIDGSTMSFETHKLPYYMTKEIHESFLSDIYATINRQRSKVDDIRSAVEWRKDFLLRRVEFDRRYRTSVKLRQNYVIKIRFFPPEQFKSQRPRWLAGYDQPANVDEPEQDILDLAEMLPYQIGRIQPAQTSKRYHEKYVKARNKIQNFLENSMRLGKVLIENDIENSGQETTSASIDKNSTMSQVLKKMT